MRQAEEKRKRCIMTEEFIRETLDYLKAKLAESLKETDASNQDAFVRAYSLD